MAIITNPIQRIKTFLQGQRIKSSEVNAELDQLVAGHNKVVQDLTSFDEKVNNTYSKVELQSAGQAAVHWGNLVGVPNLADASWKPAVANKESLPLVGNKLADQRTVLADTDGKTSVYVCVAVTGTVDQQWSKTGDVDWASDEANRVAAESVRVSSENIRITNEGNRQTAESIRNSAESARVAAESSRVTEFNAIKSEWSTAALADVRMEVISARDGHPTLGDRLDIMNDLAYGKIDKSLATAANDMLVASGAGVWVNKTIAEVRALIAGGTLNFLRNIVQQAKLKDYSETVKVIAAATGSMNLDLAEGNVFDVTLTGAFTPTFVNPAPSGDAHSFTVLLRQGATAYAVTWPSSVKWSGDTIPTISDVNKTVLLSFVTLNAGARWYGTAVTKFTT